jgi:DNA polymerase-3 subunit alpha
MADPKTYKLLADGNTLGIFQLDGGPMRDLLKMMKPTEFDDIAAVLALYRPGPMGVNAHTDYALRKNGLQEVFYIHPHLEEALKPILGDTYGLIVYQEQIMKLAQVIAGYSLGEADILRRAMGKKKKSEMDMQWERFSTGAYERGYSKDSIQTLWDTVLPFADYAFNKSHSVAYGYMSYITAYLKANFPAEYMSALLTSTADSTEKTALYLDDAKQNKIKVLPPDINHSVRDYSPLSDTQILFGLKALKGVSDSVSDTIVAERNRNGKFVDFSDVMNRLPRLTLNKRVLEAFGYGGAFDGMGYTRKSVIDSLEDLLKNYQKYSRAQKKQETMGASLFDELDFEEVKPRYEITPCEEYPNMEKLFLERATLGLYVSGHPLDGLNLDTIASTKVGEILAGNVPSVEGFAARGKEPIITIAGIAASFGARVTKAGKPFGSGILEDRTGQIDFVMFSNVFSDYGSFMKTDGLYALTGYPQKRGEGFSFIVNSVRPLEFAASGNMPVRLKLTQDQWEKGYHEMMQRLAVHENNEAKEATDVVISIRDFDGSVAEETLPIKVKPGTLLVSEMRELFGMGCIGRWRPRKPLSGPAGE